MGLRCAAVAELTTVLGFAGGAPCSWRGHWARGHVELGQHGRPVGPAVKPALPGPRAPLGRLASFFRDFGYIFASVFLTFYQGPVWGHTILSGQSVPFPRSAVHAACIRLGLLRA